jgi:hypothetical protein
MPVAVVALAAGSFAAGAATFAAATTVAGMVAAGATMVGSALTAIGTVTGNQSLTKIGAVVGIAGGIGSWMSSPAAATDAAAGATGAGSGATDAASAAGSTGADAAGSAGGVADALGNASEAASNAVTTSPVDLGGTVAQTGGGSGMLDAAPVAGSSATGSASANGMVGGSSVMPNQAPAAPWQAPATSVTGIDPAQQYATSTSSALDAGQTSIGQSVGNAMDTSSTAVGQSLNMNPFKAPTGMLDSTEHYPGAIDAAANAGAGISTPISVNPAVGSAPSGFGATLSQMQEWAKNNPELAKAAMSGTGALFNNLVPSARDKAMMDAYRSQSALTTQQTQASKQKLLWGSGRTA